MKTASFPAGLETPAGIYIHIPFCIQKCRYCDFYSVTDRRLIPAFMGALTREIRRYSEKVPFVDSLYIGGGTPSVLPVEDLSRLIEEDAARAPRAERLVRLETLLRLKRDLVRLAQMGRSTRG